MGRLVLTALLMLCGGTATAQEITPKIVGGSNATSGHWPWMALVAPAHDATTGPEARCGGVLISPYFVVSAAHCMFDENYNQFDTVLLATDTVTVPVNSAGYIPVSRSASNPPHIEVHPGYDRTNGPNRNNFNDDIVLIYVEEGIEVSRYPSLADISELERLERSGVTGRDNVFTALGWGELFFNGPLSPRLQQVTLDYIPRSTCRSAWGSLLGNRMVCAAETNPPTSAPAGQDTCRGDSGGPLLTGQRTAPIIVGLTSFGSANGCGGSNPPGVYTSIADYALWLEQRTFAFGQPIADLSVNAPSTLRSGIGTTARLNVAVRNDSFFNSTDNISASITLPVNMNIDNIAGADCQISGPALNCLFEATLDSGAEHVLSMDVTHLTEAETTESITISAAHDRFDYRSTNNTASVAITFTDRRPSGSSGGAAFYLLPLLIATALRCRKVSVSQAINSSASATGAR